MGICICYRQTGTQADVWEHQYCAGTALFVIYQVDCPGLWSVCFPVWIRSGQGRECLGNCRSRSEVSVHRMGHTRNSVALESVGSAGGWELEGHLQTALGSLRRKEQRLCSDLG